MAHVSYLDAAVLPGEDHNNRQAAYDDAGQDEYRCAHYPVQGHDTGTVIIAGLAALSALQTLEHPWLAVLVVYLLWAVTRRLSSPGFKVKASTEAWRISHINITLTFMFCRPALLPRSGLTLMLQGRSCRARLLSYTTCHHN
jgi:hypothetical protein